MTLRDDIATPDGKRRYVRRLFSTIADRYDLITALLSYGQDRRWKRRVAALAQVTPDDRVLDLACGTGDILFEVMRAAPRYGVGLDLTGRMLVLAQRRARQAAHPPPAWLAGDMLDLPFRPAAFDLVTTGYGLRNVPDLSRAMTEIARVLAPGGRFVSLDFNRPEGRFVRTVYLAYLTLVGATLGWLLHGDPDTYRYIPESIRLYPEAAAVGRLLDAHGFVDVRVVPVLGGLMAIHLARMPR